MTIAEPEIEPGKISCEVIDFNRFGNVHLNVRPADLAAARLDKEPTLVDRGGVGGGRREARQHLRGLRRGRVRGALRPTGG